MAEKRTTEIDAELLEELCRRAEEQGRTAGELLEEAVRRYLDRPDFLAKLLSYIDQRHLGLEPLSEEAAAMRLAVEEQHTWRRERPSPTS